MYPRWQWQNPRFRFCDGNAFLSEQLKELPALHFTNSAQISFRLLFSSRSNNLFLGSTSKDCWFPFRPARSNDRYVDEWFQSWLSPPATAGNIKHTTTLGFSLNGFPPAFVPNMRISSPAAESSLTKLRFFHFSTVFCNR